MTATPHNGKEEDFQLFMALLDADRFEGRFRDGVHTVDASDLMRRMVEEHLLQFDGTPLFPERIAYTVPYRLSEQEARLYQSVTDYVREEFNRAEALKNNNRAGTVGFALTILQRRPASSPEAIHQSLRRRREPLESRLREFETARRGGRTSQVAEPRIPLEELKLEARISSLPPVVLGVERRLGFEPVDREFEKLGCDIESRVPGTGQLRFIEVKGRISGAPTITVTRSEILYSLNKSEDYIL